MHCLWDSSSFVLFREDAELFVDLPTQLHICEDSSAGLRRNLRLNVSSVDSSSDSGL